MRAPVQTSKYRLPIWLGWGAAGVLTLLSCGQGVRNALLYSQDFQWSPARVLLSGTDPFAVWLSGDPAHQIILTQIPNYAHLLYLLLLPLGALPWPVAKPLWAAANLLFAGASCWLLSRGHRVSKSFALAILCVFLASTPLRVVIGNGQQVLLSQLCLYLGWTLPGTLAAAFFLAVGFSKYTFALPFALGLLLERRIGRLVGAFGFLGAGWLIFSGLSDSSPLSTLFEPVQVGSRAVGLGIADVMSLGNALHADAIAFPGAGAGLALICATFLTLALKGALARMASPERFAALGLISLMSFVHLSYDFVYLLPLALALPNLPMPRRILVAGGIGYFWFFLKLVDRLWGPGGGAVWITASWLVELAMLCAFTGVWSPRTRSLPAMAGDTAAPSLYPHR
jgi:hypothetical protein